MMSEFGETGEKSDVIESQEVDESPETSEIDDAISEQYNEYLDDDKAQEFEHKSAEEKETERQADLRNCPIEGNGGHWDGESSDLQELKPEYFEDLRNRSEYPDTIQDNGNDWERRDTAENAEMRDGFDDKKRELIRQWEDENGIPWPTYDEDVFTEAGKPLRPAGARYDAHHIQPLTYGGENVSSNITPLHALEHFDKKGVHAPDSPFGRMGVN